MNKYFRLLYTLLFSRFRSKVEMLGVCETPFRCYFNDLDVLSHMNNGVYFSLLDLGRVDFMIRAGVKGALDKNGWYPVVTAETMKFRRSINLFQKFKVQTQILGWNEKAFIVEQKFVARGDVVASAIIMARFLKVTGGTVTPAEIMAAVDFKSPSPKIPDNVQAWIDSL